MKKQILYTAPPLLLVLFLLGIMACRKDDPPQQDCPPDLPCSTQYGANTFGCYIDGVPWVAGVAPYVFDPSAHKIQSWFDEPNFGIRDIQFMQVQASLIDSFKYEWSNLAFRPIEGIGVINHNAMDRFIVEFKLSNKEGVGGVVYSIDTLSDYRIEVTKIDFERNTMSVLFSFTGITDNKEDTIQVTNGRLDVKYSPE